MDRKKATTDSDLIDAQAIFLEVSPMGRMPTPDEDGGCENVLSEILKSRGATDAEVEQVINPKRDREADESAWELICEIQGLEARLKEIDKTASQSYTESAAMRNESILLRKEIAELNAELMGMGDQFEDATNDQQSSGDIDFALLATPDQLIKAFGRFTGMDESWFKKWADRPELNSAIKVKGTSGRGRTTEPLFCPFLVMQGLMKKPRKGSSRKAFKEVETPWRMLKQNFPRVYELHQGLSPLDD